MTFETVSEKQKQVFQWWNKTDYKAIICDGAVRSGKTMCMITSFIHWAMRNFNGCNFGICGKTVASAERNIQRPLAGIADVTHYYKLKYLKGTHLLIVESKSKKHKAINYFWIFGGKDESSYTLLQGITLSGVFLDEVALMPESFVNQAIARTLSEKNAKYWFNCNPESPAHWFYNDWILKSEEHNALHLHFLMTDNPILDDEQIAEAEMQFQGVFYQRYIQGLWVVAEGLIYPMYEEAISEPPEKAYVQQYVMSIDYGTQNAFAALMWAKIEDIWYAIDEYYYSGRTEGVQKTDEQYAQDIDKFTEPYRQGEKLRTIIDPSAASFIAVLRQRKLYRVIPADNAVLDGIRNTATALQTGKIKISPKCEMWKWEAQSYVWADSEVDDVPVKVNDHCLTGDTLVMTEDGEKPISELVGTNGYVWSYNTETGKAELKLYHDCRMTQISAKNIIELKIETGKKIRCTSDHLILTQNGWKQAIECVNERIITFDGNSEYVWGMSECGAEPVYNLEVDDNHNFAINGGLIVHNCMDSARYFVQTMNIVKKKEKYVPSLFPHY